MTGRSERSTSGALWRIAALGLAMAAALGLLARRLYAVQIEESRAYAKSQMRQSVRRVHVPAVRGRIFDRGGECLADNRPSYCIALFIEDLRRPGPWSNTVNAVDARIDALSLALGLPRQISRDDIAGHVFRQLPMPLLAWQDIDGETLARFSEMVTPNSGMDVYVQPERVYPAGGAFSHVLGRVGRDKPAAPGPERSHYDILGMRGRDGLELSRDAELAGAAGGRLITVDVSGFRHGETSRPAVPGKDIALAISAPLQRLCARLLEGRRGAVAAIDPRNGDVLALVSAPSFDASAMTPRIPAKLWKELNADPGLPLLNRAVSGLYPPGSTFKPAVALAALGAGVPPSRATDCTGAFELGGMRLRCAATYGHGPGIDMRKALAVSCNPYFCELGVEIGAEAIGRAARGFGLGARTGICLPGEAAGLVPDDAWKRRAKNDVWRSGDTANLAIGQGFLLVTPLQMAMYCAALANRGTLYAPRLCLDEPVRVVRRLAIPARDFDVVLAGMSDVVNAPHGGGRLAAVPGLHVAAKTGTAEYGRRGNRSKHAWMIAFAPFEKPEIALAVVVEDGESGGHTAAPIVARILRGHFGIEDPPEAPSAPETPAMAEQPGATFHHDATALQAVQTEEAAP